jgi:hypothetical protein
LTSLFYFLCKKILKVCCSILDVLHAAAAFVGHASSQEVERGPPATGEDNAAAD